MPVYSTGVCRHRTVRGGQSNPDILHPFPENSDNFLREEVLHSAQAATLQRTAGTKEAAESTKKLSRTPPQKVRKRTLSVPCHSHECDVRERKGQAERAPTVSLVNPGKAAKRSEDGKRTRPLHNGRVPPQKTACWHIGRTTRQHTTTGKHASIHTRDTHTHINGHNTFRDAPPPGHCHVKQLYSKTQKVG